MRDCLKIEIFSPLTSWGDFYPLDGYLTAVAPTKSSIVGLIGAWMGVERGSDKILEIQESFSMISKVYSVANNSSVATDFQTVLMPKKATPFQRSRRDIYADKKNHRNFGVFKKEFLQNYAYEIILVDDGRLNLNSSPVFSPYFGRKAFSPCLPLVFRRGRMTEMVKENLTSVEGASLKEIHWEDSLLDFEASRVDTREDLILNAKYRVFNSREEQVYVYK